MREMEMTFEITVNDSWGIGRKTMNEEWSPTYRYV
jgi:hypothetical protein